MRAPIFYDSNDTGYYVNPNSTSNIVNLTVNGTFNFSSSGYLTDTNIFEKLLYASFPNGTANLATDIRFGNNSFWGYIEVEITGTYSNQNTPGKLTKLFAVGTNPNNNIYANVSRVSDVMGPIGDNIVIGDFGWDSSNSTFRIPISHIVSTGNNYAIKVRMFTYGGGAGSVYSALTLSSNYTLSALTFQPVSYNGNLLVSGNFGVGAINNSYAFYNNSTSYFNGGVTIDDTAAFSGGNQINFYTSAGSLRGYINATDTDDNHFQFATSGGEDIVFKDSGLSGTRNFVIRGNNTGSEAYGSMRSPIFYDSNDTGYYIDAASTSIIRKTNLIASGSAWDDGLNLYSSDATNRWNFLVDNGASDAFRLAYNNSEAINVNTSRNVTISVDIRSPIF